MKNVHQQGQSIEQLDRECQDVREFHMKFGQLAPNEITHLTKRKLMERAKFHLEEAFEEFCKAAEAQDMAMMADALIDGVYVLKGTAVMLGLDRAWRALWDDVHSANMRKVPGATHRGAKVDVCKPPGWVGPQTEVVLALNGYNRAQFCNLFGEIDETRCLDDLVHLEKDNP
jgi:predicted HAD superfamily Cof-like phosphohydrolase